MAPAFGRRSLLRAAGTVALSVLAGCSSEETPSSTTDTATPTPDTATVRSATAVDAESPTRTPTPSPTTWEPIGTGRNPVDVVVGNGTDLPRTLSLVVSKLGVDRPVLDDRFTLDPGGRRRWDVFDDDASGVYGVTVALSDGPERTYEWDLRQRPADGWLTIGIRDEDGGTTTFTYATA
jgi:hypothetical protein